MGNCFVNCKNTENESTLMAKNEEEIQFSQYSSLSDSQLEILEKDNNLFRYITLVEYINLLSYYTLETANIPFDGPYKITFSYKDEFLSQYFYEELFQNFIENTILKNRELGEQETTFKEMCLELFKSLKTKLKENYGEDKKVTKRDLICLGILFCKTNNINKIKIFFDLFKNEKEIFIQSNELNEYLLSSFLISSFCLISAKKKLSQTNPTIPEFSLEEIQSLLQNANLEDCINLVNYFNKNFFNKNIFYRWDQFKQKFEDENGFGWIFSSKGIRQKLQEIRNESNNFVNQVFEPEKNEE